MYILRRLGATLCALILVFSLWALLWSSLFSATLRNKETVKGWFNKSGFYTNIVDVVLDSAKSDQGSGKSDIPVNDPQIQAVAKSALSPEFLKQTVEKALDDSYGWMASSGSTLSFNIDLTEAKAKLINGLGDYAATKAAALPVCATNEPIADFDAFAAICRPRALAAEAAGQQVKDQLATNEDFLKDPVISSGDIKVKNTDGQEVLVGNSEYAKLAKRSYQFSGFAPIVAVVLGLLSTAGIIFLSRNKITGMRRVGYIFGSAGVLISIIYTSVSMLSNLLIEAVKQGDKTQGFKDLVNNGVGAISGDIKKVLMIFAVSYVVIGATLITIGIVKRKKTDEADEAKDKPSTPDEKPTEKQKEPAKPTPTPKKKPQKIQL